MLDEQRARGEYNLWDIAKQTLVHPRVIEHVIKIGRGNFPQYFPPVVEESKSENTKENRLLTQPVWIA